MKTIKTCRTYEIIISEKLQKSVFVTATDEETALEIVRERYKIADPECVLDSSDYFDVEFTILAEDKDEDWNFI